MIERLANREAQALGNAYLDLFLGRDTDEAEAAAQRLGDAVEIFIQLNAKK